MDTDLIFVSGFILGVLAIPALASAIFDGRAPRTSAMMVILSALLMGYAIAERPSAYTFDTFTSVISRVADRYIY